MPPTYTYLDCPVNPLQDGMNGGNPFHLNYPRRKSGNRFPAYLGRRRILRSISQMQGEEMNNRNGIESAGQECPERSVRGKNTPNDQALVNGIKPHSDSSSSELLTFEHVNLGYGKRTVLSNLNLALHNDDFLGIVGPNGVGKTTILKAMLGILKPLSGRVWKAPNIRLGYVPQRQYIDEAYPLTALEVALMGRYPLLGIFGRPSRKDKEFVMECLDHAGIVDLADRPYRELSGGQKQRTLIARALATQPRALILDEPTNDMDIGSEHAIMELLKQLHNENGVSIVIVSHLLNVIVNYAERFALIDEGLRMVGSTGEVLSSQNLTGIYNVPVEVAEYKGRKVVLTGERDA